MPLLNHPLKFRLVLRFHLRDILKYLLYADLECEF